MAGRISEGDKRKEVLEERDVKEQGVHVVL